MLAALSLAEEDSIIFSGYSEEDSFGFEDDCTSKLLLIIADLEFFLSIHCFVV